MKTWLNNFKRLTRTTTFFWQTIVVFFFVGLVAIFAVGIIWGLDIDQGSESSSGSDDFVPKSQNLDPASLNKIFDKIEAHRAAYASTTTDFPAIADPSL